MNRETFNNLVAAIAVAMTSILGVGTLKGTDMNELAKTVATNTSRVDRVERDVKEVEQKSDEDHERLIRIEENVKSIKDAIDRVAN